MSTVTNSELNATPKTIFNFKVTKEQLLNYISNSSYDRFSVVAFSGEQAEVLTSETSEANVVKRLKQALPVLTPPAI